MNWINPFLFTFMHLSYTSTVTFEPSYNNPGLVFEQQKNIYLSHDDWKLVYYYDLAQFYEETRKIISIKSTMIRLCDDLKQNIPLPNTFAHICTYIIKQLKNQEDHINTRDNIIKSFETPKKRNKRAPVEIIGTAAKYLFGILDSESAEKYDRDINNLKTNQSYIYELTKKQTTLIEGLITLHNTTLSEVQNELIAVNTYIREMEKRKDNQMDTFHTITQFNSLASSITLTFMHHEEMARKIYNLLTNTIHGKITDIIPTDQLKINIRDISKHLNNNIILPINMENENIYEIFKYTTIRSTLHEDKIIIELSLPLIENEKWIFYKTTPLPINNKTNCVIIRTTHTHFFTDLNHKAYIPTEKNSLKNCVKTQSKIICKINEIMTSTDKICELLLLDDTNLKKIPEECEVAAISNKNYILNTNPNKYYLSTSKPYNIRTNCNDQIKNINITTNGYLNIEPGCTAVSSFFKIKQATVKKQLNFISITPEFNFNFENFDKHIKPEKTEQNYVVHDHRKDFDNLIKKTSEIKKLEQEQLTTTQFFTYTFSPFTAIIIFTTIFVLFYCYHAYFTRKIGRTTVNTTAATTTTAENQIETSKSTAQLQYT